MSTKRGVLGRRLLENSTRVKLGIRRETRPALPPTQEASLFSLGSPRQDVLPHVLGRFSETTLPNAEAISQLGPALPPAAGQADRASTLRGDGKL